LFALAPIHLPQDASLPDNFLLLLRIGVCGFYGLLGVLAGSWIYYFTRPRVKEQFQGGAIVDGAASTGRPVSISIIGWYLVISTCFAPFAAFFHFPISIFGLYLTGRAASLVMAAVGVIQLTMGIGLLRLKPWGRTITIWYFSFFLVNSFLMVLLPGSQARFDQTMAYSQKMMGTAAMPIHFPMWIGLVFSVPLFVLLLWFVVTRKEAFLIDREGAPQLP
jgi:hypothetical protein